MVLRRRCTRETGVCEVIEVPINGCILWLCACMRGGSLLKSMYVLRATCYVLDVVTSRTTHVE